MRSLRAVFSAICIAAALSGCAQSPVAPQQAAPGPRMDGGPFIGGGNAVGGTGTETTTSTCNGGPFIGGGNYTPTPCG